MSSLSQAPRLFSENAGSQTLPPESTPVEESCDPSVRNLSSLALPSSIPFSQDTNDEESSGVYLNPVQETRQNVSETPRSTDSQIESESTSSDDIEQQPLIEHTGSGKLNNQCFSERFLVLFKLAIAAAVVAMLIIGVISILFIIGFSPDLVANEYILSNDTILLDLSSTGTPMSNAMTSYNALTVGISKPTSPVTILFEKSEVPCRANHTKTKQFDSANIPISSQSFVNVIVEQYLTPRSTLFLASTITIGSKTILDNTETITLCIIDNKDSYDHFKGNDGKLKDCKDHNKYTYYVSNRTTFSLNYTFQESRYFFIIFLSTRDDVFVQYSYNLTYYSYEIRDYTSSEKCTISESNGWQNCILKFDGAQGCFFAYAAPSVGSPVFTKMMVTLVHDPFTLLSIGLTVALGIITALSLLSIFGCICKKKRHDGNSGTV